MSAVLEAFPALRWRAWRRKRPVEALYLMKTITVRNADLERPQARIRKQRGALSSTQHGEKGGHGRILHEGWTPCLARGDVTSLPYQREPFLISLDFSQTVDRGDSRLTAPTIGPYSCEQSGSGYGFIWG